MTEDYPIKPWHVDTSEEPKGFDALLVYDQRLLLWMFFQFCQAKGNWDPFTREEFGRFIDNPQSIVHRTALALFITTDLKLLCNCKDDQTDEKKSIYKIGHFLISTYFQWNPAKRLFQ